jgi:hypothetical protein
MQPHKISPWIDLFVNILQEPVEPELETLTEDISVLE